MSISMQDPLNPDLMALNPHSKLNLFISTLHCIGQDEYDMDTTSPLPEHLPTPTNSRPSHRQQTFLPSDQPTATTATESRSVDGIYGILEQIIRKLADVETSIQRRDATDFHLALFFHKKS